MPTKTIYFSKARTALKYGLQALDINNQGVILVPDFVCESIFPPIIQNSLRFLTYEVEDDLSPVWPSLDMLVTKETKAILMVHYFGQPQNIERFEEFCAEHNLFLIEDNAHGHGGVYGEKKLGTFGDIGISSPRKFEGNGGVLYLNKNYNCEYKLPQLNSYEFSKHRSPFRLLLDKSPRLKQMLKLRIKSRPRYEDPRAFREPIMNDFFLHKESIKLDSLSDWHHIRNSRQKKFAALRKIALDGGLKPVFSELSIGSNPWCFAAYAESQLEAIQWFNWGWENNVEVFSWPPLREDQLQENNKAFERWKRIVCFSTAN